MAMQRVQKLAHTWIQMWVMYWHTARRFEESPRYLSLSMQYETEVAQGHLETAAAVAEQIDELRERNVLSLLKPINLFMVALNREEDNLLQTILREVDTLAPKYPEFIELKGDPSYVF